MTELQTLEAARDSGLLEGALGVVVYLLLHWVKSSILSRLDRIEEKCEAIPALKETQDEHGEKLDMLHERVSTLEVAKGN